MPDQPVQMVGLGNMKATLALPYLLASPAKQVPLPPKTAKETVEDLFPQPSTSTPGSRQNGSGLPHKLQLLIADLNRNLSHNLPGKTRTTKFSHPLMTAVCPRALDLFHLKDSISLHSRGTGQTPVDKIHFSSPQYENVHGLLGRQRIFLNSSANAAELVATYHRLTTPSKLHLSILDPVCRSSLLLTRLYVSSYHKSVLSGHSWLNKTKDARGLSSF